MTDSSAPKEFRSESVNGNPEPVTQAMIEATDDTGLGKEMSAVVSERKSAINGKGELNEVRFMTRPQRPSSINLKHRVTRQSLLQVLLYQELFALQSFWSTFFLTSPVPTSLLLSTSTISSTTARSTLPKYRRAYVCLLASNLGRSATGYTER